MNNCPYCQNSFDMTETCADEFRLWQGLIGPYYIPSIDENGILSWTNTGELPNPSPVNITGKGLTIGGIVESAQELPDSADDYVTYLVGEEEPYNGYMWDGSEWVDLGVIGRGEKGDQGDPGIGIPASGTTGQVLAKKSNTNYDTDWVNPSGGADPATSTPLMDGTAAVGTATKYAREDHVHPSDTSKQDTLVSGTNIKTVGGQSLLGSGNVDAGGALYFTSVAVTATTGDIVTISDAAITADHVLAECVFANPSAITTDLTWTSASGSFKLNGTCASATTCNIVLVKKNN